MSIIPVGRRSEMVGQMFRLAQDQIHQPDHGSAFMTSGVSRSPLPSEAETSGAPVVGSTTGAAADSVSFHDFVHQELENLGIEPRIISRKSNSLIKFKEDIRTGKMSGSFLIPIELPSGDNVLDAKAREIALKIFDKFGLEGDIGRDQDRKFYVVSFYSKPEDTPKSNNEGSFGNLPDNKSNEKTTTASVQSEMLLNRKAMLIDALRKGGYIK
jgi:hypothetical protein